MLSRSGLIMSFLRGRGAQLSPFVCGRGRKSSAGSSNLIIYKKNDPFFPKRWSSFSASQTTWFSGENPNKDSFADKFLTGASDPSPNIKEKSIFCSSTLLCLCSRWLIYILTNRFARKPDSKEKPFMCLPDTQRTLFIPLAALSNYFDAGCCSQTLKSAI